jgi:CheY-like chemotaxis protein
MQPDKTPPQRILIVDDEPTIRETLKLLLRFDGHSVTEAANGREACLAFTPGDFDLVITDHTMPEMNGDELARTIKCLVPSQPMLMLTAHAGKVCSADNPVDAVLEKPFTLSALRQMLKLLCGAQSRKAAAVPVPVAAASAI